MRRLFIPIAVAAALLMSCAAPQPEIMTMPNQEQYLQRGQTLATGLAACGFCHSSSARPGLPLSGGKASYDMYGEVKAANLTPSKSGIGKWSVFEIVQVLRTSKDREGRELSGDVHAGYEWMSDPDALAIATYLRSLPPVENEVERRELSFIDTHTTGIMESRREVSGYVPAVSPRFELEYGRYLVDNVARCGGCHNATGTLLMGELYLGGGKVIRTEKGEKRVPGISSSEADGIGTWSEEAIVQYLTTARTPDNQFIDTDYCPVQFYRRAPASDLRAIARYLKTVPAVD